jgi:phosphoglycerol transferase MdoB-like AlkP superfamily enzyme
LAPKSLLTLLTVSALGVWLLTRVGLWLYTGPGNMTLAQSLGAFAWGAWFDLATLAYLVLPFALASLCVPTRWRLKAWYLRFRWVLYWFCLYALVFGGVAEAVFWQEFSTRFNFIAVDYLVYTHEVVGNIQESYPLALIFSGIAVFVTLVFAFVYRHIRLTQEPRAPRKRLLALAGFLALPFLSASVASIDQSEFGDNAYANELAGNGLFGFASAFRRNDLDYDKFYAQLEPTQAQALLASLGVPRATPTGSALSTHAAGARADNALASAIIKRPRNVVLVSVESLSAEYLGTYGSRKGLSPRMDQYASQGVVLGMLFATGTRTVRGLEALSLGTPPVPGQAIVHRPNNDHLSTVGQLLQQQGFDTLWMYGGYGYFDNMNAYFKGNGHAVLDRTDFPKSSLAGENIWGVADESLFDNVLLSLDRSYASGKRFYAHVMTTSNHRPYTFPDGRIDLPSGTREAAVKYTDYAIGRFLDQAKAKPWFKDTLFVIVADHCASVAGNTKLPVESYHIAGFLYGPQLLKPAHDNRLLSQIDIPPTLMDLLQVKGGEQFFGESLLATTTGPQRVFISNYQELGYYKNDRLVVLSPKRRSQTFAIDPKTLHSTPLPETDPVLTREAIAYYQTASRNYKEGLLKAP